MIDGISNLLSRGYSELPCQTDKPGLEHSVSVCKERVEDVITKIKNRQVHSRSEILS